MGSSGASSNAPGPMAQPAAPSQPASTTFALPPEIRDLLNGNTNVDMQTILNAIGSSVPMFDPFMRATAAYEAGAGKPGGFSSDALAFLGGTPVSTLFAPVPPPLGAGGNITSVAGAAPAPKVPSSKKGK